ncbi:MAG TPA: PD-(D/E)XK nuclease family protein [Candidatus Dormibacteraeota bacterium]|nr:PD-(D/E)XK nuclease family protein [Candidatus Dormibacteraeota bacterium]
MRHNGARAVQSDFDRFITRLRPTLDDRARGARNLAPDFSLLQWLGLERAEWAHSKIIKNLLDPHGTHGQGTWFVESFVRHCRGLENFPIVLDKKRLSDRRVYVDAEVGSALGRPDIRVVSSAPDFALIIENKIDQQDQTSQLARYWEIIRSDYRRMGRNVALVYLTPGGYEARDSKAKAVPYARMSYRTHLSQWLRDAAGQIKPVSLKAFLTEYVALVAMLTEAPVEEDNGEG